MLPHSALPLWHPCPAFSHAITLSHPILSYHNLSYAGVGNIYRAEILFKAGIHPEQPANSLDRAAFESVWAHRWVSVSIHVSQCGHTCESVWTHRWAAVAVYCCAQLLPVTALHGLMALVTAVNAIGQLALCGQDPCKARMQICKLVWQRESTNPAPSPHLPTSCAHPYPPTLHACHPVCRAAWSCCSAAL